MPQLGTDEKPFVMSTGTIASKESRFRKKFDKKSYDFNYDRIFRKASENKKKKTATKKGKQKAKYGKAVKSKMKGMY